MTAPKHVRLGFSQHSTAAENRAFGQWVFLQTFARKYPAVLGDLATIAEALRAGHDASPALDAWATKWYLTDAWCRAHALATVEALRDYPSSPWVWYDHAHSEWGHASVDHGPVVRPKKDPAHVDWLVELHGSDVTFHALAERVNATVVTVHEACSTLAALIGLTVRPRHRGRPRQR